MPEELYTSRDFCELAEKFEELKRENEELVSDKTYLINAAMDGGDKYHYTAHDIAYRDLERKCKALEAENAELEEARRWIPVGERLPEENQQILSTDGKEFYLDCYARWEGKDNPPCFYDRLFLWAVTHWMPLPELPEVQE